MSLFLLKMHDFDQKWSYFGSFSLKYAQKWAISLLSRLPQSLLTAPIEPKEQRASILVLENEFSLISSKSKGIQLKLKDLSCISAVLVIFLYSREISSKFRIRVQMQRIEDLCNLLFFTPKSPILVRKKGKLSFFIYFFL